MAAEKRSKGTDSNRDPLSGEPGAHPVGAGVGAAVGGAAAGMGLGVAGAAAAGTAMGAAAGPVGAVVGAIAGGIIGGLTGKEVAERIDPTTEDTYWRENYHSRPYVEEGSMYDEYQPAYRYGWESRARYHDKSFDEIEPELNRGWTQNYPKSKLRWDKAKRAVRDAWDRIEENVSNSSSKSRSPKSR